MSLKIASLKRKSKEIREFNKREWKLVHPMHFGHEQDVKLWTKRKFAFKAEIDEEIVGTLDGNYVAGVMYISQLIVAGGKRGLGIGKKLMSKAEKLAKKNKLHLIYLKTGIKWRAITFYESLGYEKEAKIKQFKEKKDFWVMTKQL